MSERKSREKNSPEEVGISRRGFITSVGAGIVGTAVVTKGQAAPVEIVPTGEMMPVTLRINGRSRKVLVEARWSLAEVMRDGLGLTGTKIGCGRGECGSCTVLFDGRPRYACMTLAVEADRYEITTAEGLMKGEELGVVQQAFVEQDAFQCGFCTTGQVVAVEGLLRSNPDPSLEEIRVGVSGNLCRCGSYRNIFRAARRAAEMKRS